MNLKILCPQWGSEHLAIEVFLEKVKRAGYNGVDMPVPANKNDRRQLTRLLKDYQLIMVSHQHQAKGETFYSFCKSFEYYLELSFSRMVSLFKMTF
ncbi:MAG: hypothetical protein PW786_02155 [Arachidicoccus sp.]|nr:hypothetical protein [Arachidicoccus sp.]